MLLKANNLDKRINAHVPRHMRSTFLSVPVTWQSGAHVIVARQILLRQGVDLSVKALKIISVSSNIPVGGFD